MFFCVPTTILDRILVIDHLMRLGKIPLGGVACVKEQKRSWLTSDSFDYVMQIVTLVLHNLDSIHFSL